MTVLNIPATVQRPDAPAAGRGYAIALLPFVLILLWTCAVRLPFYGNVGDDEFFFAVIAQKWLAGGLPYVATFDVKPPGLFALYAVAQSLFGESLATIKGLEILFTALGGYVLYRLARDFGSRPLALWIGALYPVYSLALSGVTAVNLIVQLPFFIVAFDAMLHAARQDRPAASGVPAALLAGLSIGMAGMIRQAAVFEAIAVFGLLLWLSPSTYRLRKALAYIAGAALPVLGFGLYFALRGHLRDAIRAVIVAALARSQGEVIAAHGQAGALHLTTWDVVGGLFAMAPPLLILCGCSLLVWSRWSALKQKIPSPLLLAATVWLAAAAADVLAARTMFSYYLLSTMPPLLLLASAFTAHGLNGTQTQIHRARILLAALMVICPLAIDRTVLFSSGLNGSEDRLGAERAAASLKALDLKPNEHVLVLNRGLLIYVAAHTSPPTPYFHPKHLLCAFSTPSADPLGEALAARPRFVIIADASIYRLCEQPARFRMVESTLKAHYRLAATTRGTWDEFSIYQRTS